MRRMPGREEDEVAEEAAAAAAAVEEKLPGIGEKLPGARWPRGGIWAMSEGGFGWKPGDRSRRVKRDVSGQAGLGPESGHGGGRRGVAVAMDVDVAED